MPSAVHFTFKWVLFTCGSIALSRSAHAGFPI